MDLALGQDGYVTVRLDDPGMGAPFAGAAGAIDWALYGPLSDTVALGSGVAAGTHAGDGVYPIALDKALLVTPGLHTLRVTTLAPDMTAQRFPVRVGTIAPGAWTLRDLLVSLCRGTGGSARPSQLLNNATLTDDYWIFNGSTADFRGSEVVVIDPATLANWADWRRGRVTTFAPATGVFTLNRVVSAAGDATGRYYLITSQGFPFERLLEELRVAWDERLPTVIASTGVALATAANQSEYAIPAEFSSVARVLVRDINEQPADSWSDLGGQWEVLKDRRLLRLNPDLGLDSQGYSLRVEGAVRADLPATGGGSTSPLPGVWLRERARFGLLSSSPLPAHQRAANAVYANLSRMPSPRRRALPGEVWLR